MEDIIDSQEEHQSNFSFLTSRKFLAFLLFMTLILVIFLGWKIIQAPTHMPEPARTIDCGVLMGKQCFSAEAHSRPVPGGQENYAAFHLAKGIPVFSPFDGEIFAAFTPPSGPGDFPQGATLMQVRSQDCNSAVNIMGSIESKVNKGDVVHKGQVIAVSAQ